MKGHEPFDHDVDVNGRYLYTGPKARKSALVANSRQSSMAHSMIAGRQIVTILDLGCGDGTFTSEYLQFPGVEIVGLDPSIRAIVFASRTFANQPRISFISSPIENLIADKKFFDLVILRGVLHHCEDPADLINQAAQLSNSILILEPNGLNPILKIIEKLSPYHRAHSEKSFTKTKIQTWLLTSGLSIEKFERGVLVPYFFPTALVDLMSSLEPIVARIPFLRRVLMGTQVILASKNSYKNDISDM